MPSVPAGTQERHNSLLFDIQPASCTQTTQSFNSKTGVIGQNVCPFWLVFLCGGGRSSCSSCMGGELEVGQNVCPEWPVRPCGTTVE